MDNIGVQRKLHQDQEVIETLRDALSRLWVEAIHYRNNKRQGELFLNSALRLAADALELTAAAEEPKRPPARVLRLQDVLRLRAEKGGVR